MITFRNIASAFLIHDNNILLMKRGDDVKIMPGFWSGVGGHLECEEINNPRAACLREIYEETGIRENQISDLKLKYIVLRRWFDEIVINYMYFGKTITSHVIENDEGTLHWVNKDSVLSHLFFDAISLTLAHYLEHGDNIDNVLTGIVTTFFPLFLMDFILASFKILHYHYKRTNNGAIYYIKFLYSLLPSTIVYIIIVLPSSSIL